MSLLVLICQIYKQIYKQMVLPFFDYLDILIDSGMKNYIDKLQRLQF